MSSFQKFTGLGRLTRDPELKQLPSGTSVTNFGLAFNRNYTKASGEKVEEVFFIDCVSWGKQAEAIANHVKKGEQVLVDGRLSLNEWETKDGGKRSKVVVNVDNCTFLSNRKWKEKASNEESNYRGNEQSEEVLPSGESSVDDL